MKIVTIDDFRDIYFKIKQKGWNFVFLKLNFNRKLRTKHTFNYMNDIFVSEWYVIPQIKKRWNTMITGNENISYEDFLMKEVFAEKSNLRLLSLGSGACSHELKFASYSNFAEIICVDIAQNRLNEAKKTAMKNNVTNIHFVCSDIHTHIHNVEKNYFDIVLFHSSLHHFKNKLI